MANTSPEIPHESAAASKALEMSFELSVVPVKDADRSKNFYQNLGWACDLDYKGANGYRVIQLTPAGSRSSIIVGSGLTDAAPGSARGMHLIVSDIVATRKDLLQRGVIIGEIFYDPTGIFHHADSSYLASGPNPERKSYASYASFQDPDGNVWMLQEITARLPPHTEADETHFTPQLMEEVHREFQRA
ncbi:hypothetical protein [Terriglobus sp. TAA 43]|uniref:hypothetical protein n=1 Tax=Terriglobus sp. TAA 43 TaxID=278961 RepID=UPI000645CE2E|nr:hypothetical protein [Terriglobus sp. TAA 43]